MFQQSKQARSLVSSSLSSPGVVPWLVLREALLRWASPLQFLCQEVEAGAGRRCPENLHFCQAPSSCYCGRRGPRTGPKPRAEGLRDTFTRDRPVALGQLSPPHCVLPWNEARQLLTGRQGHVTPGEGERTAVGEARPAKAHVKARA